MNANDQNPASRTGQTNLRAIAALVCGVAQLLVPLAFVAAIILGHKARRQIRLTGQGGYGIATAGMILGYFALAWLTILAVLVVPATIASSA
jgi:Domain of unknown function (DUF4190)